MTETKTNAEQLKAMITHYKNNGDRVDEVLFQTVMDVIQQAEIAQDAENIMKASNHAIKIANSENERLRAALEVTF